MIKKILLGLLILVCQNLIAQDLLHAKLKTIATISEIKPLEKGEFAEKYVTYFNQPLDHQHPEKGSFRE